ncbi:MAG: LuxR C-terminal-related transcriptional regulator, partial [Chloroflexi bacterium]|nr:LuxR C-terminal-related transcriptional regulator [Chloroflexota bacterium]
MPMLATKLYIPPLRPKVVLRPRLIERLNTGLQRRLTLISAPAGFGKTTLISEWLQTFRAGEGATERQGDKDVRQPLLPVAPPPAVAWLSLDPGDDDLIRFLTYLVMALQTVAANLGAELLGLLEAPQPPPAEALLTSLLNELTKLPNHVVLVLDDYHVLDGGGLLGAIDQALAFLLEHLPPQMHLVITTREDPHLPLARLRARGQLTELRAADLRFTADEAAEFLNQVMGLRLSAAHIAALEERTEGWIVGLQLAALSMQDHQDVPGFIQAFAGDHRYIVDYLVEEVLQRQPEQVRSFLLQTAILDQLSGGLCDAVTGQRDGGARLEALQRGNFFVVPLDDKRQWYRYHHLFAEVLHAHLRVEQPDQISALHRRASAWYEQHGLLTDTIRHALAAEDFAHVADLIEQAVPAMRRSRQEVTLLGWLKALPDEVVYNRPVLSVHYAGTLLQSGELQGVEARLRDAERWLDAGAEIDEPPHSDFSVSAPTSAHSVASSNEGSRPSTETNPAQSRRMVVLDAEQFRRLPGWIAIYRAGQALVRGDVPGTLHYARRALDLVPEDELLGRGAAGALLGLAYWTSGDLEAAYRTYTDGIASVQRAGHISDAIGSAIALADIRIAQGRLREAMHIYERALQLAIAQGTPKLRGTADMYVGMSELHREHNDLPAAMQHLLRSKDQGEHTGFPQNAYRWRVAMARIRQAQGDLAGALDLLQEAEPLYVSDFFPNVRPIAASKARVWIAQGRLGEAFGWAREQSLSADDDLSYLHEFEHITLARLLLAQYQRDHAEHALLETMGLLARLRQAAEAGGRMGNVIESLLLQALAHQAQGDIPAALVLLERALMLAEPEGYVRLFVDEGEPLAQLLREAAAPSGRPAIMPGYTAKLLAAFEKQQTHASESPLPAAPTPTPFAAQPLIEPLSQRELEVLRLFKTELSGPEIAQQLVIGLSTVRTHTKSIFSKLTVNDR